MAITDAQKIDYLWKKLGYGAAKTDTNENKLAINEAIASPLLIRGDKVWTEAASIPTVKPSSSSGVVTIYSNVETTEDITATSDRTWKTNIVDWIPPEFGSTYQVVVYAATSGESDPVSNGTRLFASGSGNNDEWYFDYQAGILHFIGNNLPSSVNGTNVLFVSGATYGGDFGTKNLSNAIDSDLSLTSSDQIIDVFDKSLYRTVKYIVQLEHDSDRKYHSAEILLTHNDSAAFITEYALVHTDSELGEFNASIDSNNISLMVTPSYTNTSIKAKRISIDA